MRKSLLALVAFVPVAFAQTQTYTYSYSGVPLPVYPDDWNTVAVASIMVPRSITISKVTVGVQVQFNNVADLNVGAELLRVGEYRHHVRRQCAG